MEPAVPRDIGSAANRVRRLTAPTPRVALTIAAAVTLSAVILMAAGAVKPFVLGVLLVYLLAPAVDRLAARGLPRAFSVLVVFVTALAVVVIAGAIALAPLLAQIRLFVDDLPGIATDLREALLDFYQGLSLSPEIRDLLDHLLANAGDGLGGLDLGAIVSPLVTSIVGLLSTITAYAILPAWLFFLLKDRIRLAGALEAALPPGWRSDVFAVSAIVNRVFGNWVRGQLILGATVGVVSYVGLMVLSALVDPVFGRYAVLLAIIAGLLELVPFIGPIIAAIPAVLIGLTVGPGGFVASFLLYLGIQQAENNVLVPKIQGDAVELHPSAVLFALVVGAALGGILGAIVSLPIAAASRDIFRYAFHRVGEPPESVEDSLARISPRLVSTVRRSAIESPSEGGTLAAAGSAAESRAVAVAGSAAVPGVVAAPGVVAGTEASAPPAKDTGPTL